MLVSGGGTAWSQGIIYVVPSQLINYNVFVAFQSNVDINGDGVVDFTFFGPAPETGVGNAVLAPLGNNSVIAIPEPPPDLGYLVAALNQGTIIGSSLDPIPNAQWYNNQTDQFGHAAISAVAGIDNNLSEISYFAGLSTGYIGFDLVDNGTNHYGWMYVTSPVNDLAIYGEVQSWDYETSPNTPITVGAVPEPSTWGLLMLSAILFVAKRKRPSFPKAARVCWNSGN